MGSEPRSAAVGVGAGELVLVGTSLLACCSFCSMPTVCQALDGTQDTGDIYLQSAATDWRLKAARP